MERKQADVFARVTYAREMRETRRKKGLRNFAEQTVFGCYGLTVLRVCAPPEAMRVEAPCRSSELAGTLLASHDHPDAVWGDPGSN